MPSFNDVSNNTPATADSIQQVIDALKGTAGKGIPLSPTAVNDPLNFAVSIKNTDSGASKALVVYKADSTVLFQVDKNGVIASPDGILGASQLATLAGAQTFTNKTFVNPTIQGLVATGLTADGSTSALILRDSANRVLLNVRDDGTILPGTNTVWDFATPTASVHISDFTNMQHLHTSAASGGVVVAVPVGCIMDYAGATAPTGWLLCDGSAVSRTTYAALFAAIGTTFGAGDGSTTFNLPDLRSRVTLGAGTGAGLSVRTLAAVGGEETHALSLAELAAHAHGQVDGTHTHTVTVTDPTHNHTQNAHGHTASDGGHSHANVDGSAVNWVRGGNAGSQNYSFAAGSNAFTSSNGTGTANVSVANSTPTNIAAGTGVTASTDSRNANVGANTGSTGSGAGHNTMPPFIVMNKIIRT